MKWVCVSRDLSTVVGPFLSNGEAKQWASQHATHTGQFQAITFSGWITKALTPAMAFEAPPADV